MAKPAEAERVQQGTNYIGIAENRQQENCWKRVN